ncbi:M3 family metallopeptidase [Kutzneria sp. NPDC052558]|uniref:M3 family metallopeptidase n=1 Tax=Kutzneria sp. NPDC052558 TaxID=3364121 RepID=UPI0037CC2278
MSNHAEPDYSTVTGEQIAEACQAAIAACDAQVAEILAVPGGSRTAANTLFAVETAVRDLADADSGWTFLKHVSPDEAVRDSARHWGLELENRAIALKFDEGLYRAVVEFAGTEEAAALTGEDARLLEWMLRDYRRDGHELPAAERERLRALSEELVRLGADFAQGIADWDDGIEVDRAELDGLPEDYIAGLTRSGDRYRVSLDYPELRPFLANAHSAERRRELLERELRRGGPDNVARLERAIAVRAEIARMLGHDSWVDYTTEIEMTGRRAVVADFLDELRDLVAPHAERDVQLLLEIHDGPEVAPWDLAYLTNQTLRTRYDVDDQEVAQYFPLDACLDGLFHIARQVFGVRCVELPDAPVWHPDVRAYAVEEAATGVPVARFYLDLFPRPGKFTHAAALELRFGRRLPDGSYQHPVSAVAANLTRPTETRPSLLRHREVVTLFHEFGHVLHDSLMAVEHGRFSASSTERDFIEAPSQIMERWCWDADVLAAFSRHHVSGEPLPAELLARMIEAKNVAAAIATQRQIFFASLDLAYHSADFDGDSTAALREAYRRNGLPYPEGTHLQSALPHMFGYDGRLYSYLWARVIADDMYTRFEESGPMDPATGARFREAVLAPGGSAAGSQLVGDFLGRETNYDAFLRNLGLIP